MVMALFIGDAGQIPRRERAGQEQRQ